MAFTFRPGQREALHLLIGLAGGTGSGKTYSALRLAAGIAGPGQRIAVIDTENRRSLYYADDFPIDHCDLSEPFTPARYIDALQAGVKTGAPVIVIDSLSHIWAGDGGILDQQETALQKMAGDDYKKREACRMSSWIQPKLAHKKFVTKLLQVPAHVICCHRAEPKIEMVKRDGAWTVQPKASLAGAQGWIPVAEKNLPYEMTASFLLLADNPGVPIPIKLPRQLQAIFPLDQIIGEPAGAQLAAWAQGGVAALVDWPARIAGAATREDLEAIGRDIKAATLSTSTRRTLRAAYDAKRKTFGPAAPVTTADIQWRS